MIRVLIALCALVLTACGGGGDPYYNVPKCDAAALAKPGGGIPACPDAK